MKRWLAVLLAWMICLSSLSVSVEAAAVKPLTGVTRNGYVIRRGGGEESSDEEEEQDTEDPSEEAEDTLEQDDTDVPEDPSDVPEGDAEADIIPAVTPYVVEPGLENVENAADFNFTEGEMALLQENGFYVDGQEWAAEFCDIYQDNAYRYTPSFITVDSMMHMFHLYFSNLLRNTEKNYLADRLSELCDCMLDVSLQQAEMTEGTDWEDAALRNVAFFNVAFMLISPDAWVEDLAAEEVEEELALIEEASEMKASPIFGDLEDYSQYKPRGYYEGDETLERYFRTMMWLGRMNFSIKDEDETKSAILITHALKELYAEDWQEIYDITSYFAGTSDDPGYPEYDSVLQQVLGEDYQEDDFMNDEALAKIMEGLEELPPPQVASSYSAEDGISYEICFRFMGQRFTLDAAIMQKLVAPEVSGRGLPSVLDFLAALDSDTAETILKAQGTMDFPNYEENLHAAEEEMDALPEEFWQSSLYAGWQQVLLPLLEDKEEGYPTFMQNGAWAVKTLETFAGSFAELKHDTVLYSKQTMAEGDFDPPVKDDHGYVEPEYEVYGRLAALAQRMLSDLQDSDLVSEEDIAHLELLKTLAETLRDISVKELLEEPLTDEDYTFIRSYGESLGHLWTDIKNSMYGDEYITYNDMPASIVVDIATDADAGAVLEIGTGQPNAIYVVVPIDGTLRVARGAVYDYYEFAWDGSDRLTDSQWRKIQNWQHDEDGYLPGGKTVGRPDWTRYYRGEVPEDPDYVNPWEYDETEKDQEPEDEEETVPDEADETEPEEADVTEPEDEDEPEPDEGDETDEGDQTDDGSDDGKGNNPVPAHGSYDYSALTYAGRYMGENGYDISFSAYTMVDEDASEIEVGSAEILFGGKEEYVTLALYEYDPKQWDYDAVYVIRRDGGDEYFGFYEWDGEIWMDYFNDDRDLDSLVMTEHYES